MGPRTGAQVGVMSGPGERSWFAIDGGTPPGQDIAFPAELAQRVIAAECPPGAWVLDPFAGFGTVPRTAQALGRHAVGVEFDPSRAAIARDGLLPPSSIIQGDCRDLVPATLPTFDLVLTSPPYCSVRLEDDPWGAGYFDFLDRAFQVAAAALRPRAALVVEVSTLRTSDGYRPLAWQVAQVLAQRFEYRGEVVRCNTGPQAAGPGVDHSFLLSFRNARPTDRRGWDMGSWRAA